MALLKSILQFCSAVRSQFSVYQLMAFVIQICIAFACAFWSPVFIRSIFLPDVVQYRSPLHFTFTTCRDNLAGVCSFPTAHVSLSDDRLELPSGIFYELSVDIPLYSTEANNKLGVFQMVLEGFDDSGKKTGAFRRTVFIKQPSGSGVIQLVKRAVFFPIYLLGGFNDDVGHDLHIHFTDRFVDKPDAKTVLFSVQLQNRFAEVESGVFNLRARFGLIRNFLYCWPILSSVVVYCLSLTFNLTLFVAYWGSRGIFSYIKLRSPEDIATGCLNEPEMMTKKTAGGEALCSTPSSGFQSLNSSYYSPSSTNDDGVFKFDANSETGLRWFKQRSQRTSDPSIGRSS